MIRPMKLAAWLALMPVAALAQQQPDTAQAALILSLNLQRQAVEAQDMGTAINALTIQLAKEKANAAYWQDACQSTPECGGKPK